MTTIRVGLDISFVQGRLSLTTAVPITTSDVTGATTVYFTPIDDSLLTIGGATETFSEISLALDSNSGHTGYQQADKNFDLFLYDDAGTTRLATGPAWTNDTTRAEAVELVDGLWVNSTSMTVRYGTLTGDTDTVAANDGLLVGTMRATANGQTEDSLAKRFLSNAYNQALRPMEVIDATATWTYSTAAYRQANGSTANQIAYVACLQGIRIKAQSMNSATSSTTTNRTIKAGIGLNRTTTNDATMNMPGSASSVQFASSLSMYDAFSAIGYHYLARLEKGGGTDTQTWHGTAAAGDFQTGIMGEVEG